MLDNFLEWNLRASKVGVPEQFFYVNRQSFGVTIAEDTPLEDVVDSMERHRIKRVQSGARGGGRHSLAAPICCVRSQALSGPWRQPPERMRTSASTFSRSLADQA